MGYDVIQGRCDPNCAIFASVERVRQELDKRLDTVAHGPGDEERKAISAEYQGINILAAVGGGCIEQCAILRYLTDNPNTSRGPKVVAVIESMQVSNG